MKNKTNQEKEIKILSPNKARKGDKVFIVRNNQVYLVGEIRK